MKEDKILMAHQKFIEKGGLTKKDGVSESNVKRLVMCGCNGSPCRGAVCNYVTVGGKYCKAPDKYECEYKNGC